MRLDDATNDAYQHALKKAEGGAYSDFKITCGEKEYSVHKVLLCTRSSFFEKACNGVFKEAESNIINLPEDDPDAVDAMIFYIYNGYYPRTESGLWAAEEKGLDLKSWKIEEFGEATIGLQIEFLALHAKVYALAEKYEVLGLKEMALRNFKFIASQQTCVAEFSVACEIVYTTTVISDRGLHDIVVGALYKNHKALGENHIKDVLQRFPELMYDFVMHHRSVQPLESNLEVLTSHLRRESRRKK